MKTQYLICVLLALIGLASTLTSKQADRFSQWQAKFKIKTKSDSDLQYRKLIFNKKCEKIDKHNSDPSKSYKKGLNKFSHLTKEQFVKTYLGHKKVNSKALKAKVTHQIQLPAKTSHLQTGTGTVNWTKLGYTTSVKDQGECGSCWTFATTGALEGISAKRGYLQSFSEQQLLDCTSDDYWGNYGCDGGFAQVGLYYAMINGVVTENKFPYIGYQDYCWINSGSFKISDYKVYYNCASLDSAILSNPIAISVMADYWDDYESGIFNDCYDYQTNHAVLLTGRTSNAYIIKNSWSTEWGELGYIRLALNNCCGMCQEGYRPIS